MRAERDIFCVAKLGWLHPCIVIHVLKQKRRPSRTSLEKLGMIANFSELHHQVHQVLNLHFRLEHLKKFLEVQLLLEGIIEMLLPFSHFAHDLVFNLLTDFVLNVFLHSP
jgi:hypothetical protein